MTFEKFTTCAAVLKVLFCKKYRSKFHIVSQANNSLAEIFHNNQKKKFMPPEFWYSKNRLELIKQDQLSTIVKIISGCAHVFA